jgi:hypothetical protein
MEVGPMQAKAHMVWRLWIYLFQWSTLQSHWMSTNLCSARDPSLESCMLVNIKLSPLFGVCYPFDSSSCFVFVLFSILCRRETAKKRSFSTKSHALAVLCCCPYDLRLHVHQRKQRLFLLEFMHPVCTSLLEVDPTPPSVSQSNEIFNAFHNLFCPHKSFKKEDISWELICGSWNANRVKEYVSIYSFSIGQ